MQRWWDPRARRVGTENGAAEKLKIDFCYDAGIPLLGLNPRGLRGRSWRDMRTPVLTEATCLRARRREATEMSMHGGGECVQNAGHAHHGILFSFKKEGRGAWEEGGGVAPGA